jgi:tetratricopeptide (TPR) repeat protein
MTAIWCALAATALALAQEQSISPEKANQQLSVLIGDSDRTKVMGDPAAAVKGYEEALARVKSEPALKDREEEVLQHLASGYIAAQRPVDAVRVNRRILEFHEEDCKPGAPGVERCADAQYGLGLSMMHAGEFAGAVTYLTQSAENFGKVQAEGDLPFRMTKLKQRGDAESLLAAALFRAGEKEKAIAKFRQAIASLKTVADEEKLDPGTRGSARTSLTDAETSLKLIEGK